MIAKQMPYDVNTIFESLMELVDEKVLHIEDDFLVQHRMVKDGELSDKRASSGGKGGKRTQEKTKQFATKFAKAKSKANAEYENEIENEVDTETDNVVVKQKKQRKKFVRPTLDEVRQYAESEMIGSKELPEKFFYHYEANGWMINKVPMKNWQAAYKNWNKRESNGTYQQSIPGQFAGQKQESEFERWKNLGADIEKGRRELAELRGFATD